MVIRPKEVRSLNKQYKRSRISRMIAAIILVFALSAGIGIYTNAIGATITVVTSGGIAEYTRSEFIGWHNPTELGRRNIIFEQRCGLGEYRFTEYCVEDFFDKYAGQSPISRAMATPEAVLYKWASDWNPTVSAAPETPAANLPTNTSPRIHKS